jgi:hypothetical protein
MSDTTVLLPYQPAKMSPVQLAAVSHLARYAGHTHRLYAYQLRRCFAWCESHGLDPLVGIQPAYVTRPSLASRRRLRDALIWRPVSVLRPVGGAYKPWFRSPDATVTKPTRPGERAREHCAPSASRH